MKIKNYTYSSKISFALLGLCLLVLGIITQRISTATLNIQNINFVGIADPLDKGMSKVTGPVAAASLKNFNEVKQLEISFSFITRDATFSYGNLFQTGDSLDAIRMEFQPPHGMVLIIGESTLLPLSTSIEAGKKYDVLLQFEQDKTFKVFIDKHEVLDIRDKSLLSGKFDLADITVGTGLAKQRTFPGSVQNFGFKISYTYYGIANYFSRFLLVFICGLLYLNFFRNSICPSAEPFSQTNLANSFIDTSKLFGLTLIIFTIAVFAIRLFNIETHGNAKWLVYLSAPAALFAAAHTSAWSQRHWKKIAWIFALVFLGYFSALLVSTSRNSRLYDMFILGVMITSAIAFSLAMLRERSASVDPTKQPICFKNMLALSILVLLLTWSSLLGLTNWKTFYQALDAYFATQIMSAFLVLGLIFATVIINHGRKKGSSTSTPKKKLGGSHADRDFLTSC